MIAKWTSWAGTRHNTKINDKLKKSKDNLNVPSNTYKQSSRNEGDDQTNKAAAEKNNPPIS